MSQPLEPSHAHDGNVFAPAIKLVPQLVAILSSDERRDTRISAAQQLIDQQLISKTPDTAQRYLGCLLNGYIHQTRKQDDALDADLRTFIQGDYAVQGSIFAGGNYKSEAHNSTIILGADGTADTISINQGNHLALWNVCASELEKITGDKDTAKRLASSTMRLGMDRIPSNYSTVPMQHFCEAVTKHDCNPFAETRILEFAGYHNALSDPKQRDKLPLIRLLGHYEDYTPVDAPTAKGSTDGAVTLKHPTPFFKKAATWDNAEKFDYVIASNVFCKGAYMDADKDQNLVFQDVLPHLSHALRDGGKLVISNTTNDSMYLFDAARAANLPIAPEKLGLKLSDPLNPIHSDKTHEAGLYTAQRDYGLRHNAPYTIREHLTGASPEANYRQMAKNRHVTNTPTQRT